MTRAPIVKRCASKSVEPVVILSSIGLTGGSHDGTVARVG
jgi:hypothetical protein